MRSDANKIGLRVVRNILAGARPFELEVAGTRVTCGVSSGTTRPWPRIDRLSVEDDGPEWPTRVVVDCGWPGGTCKLEVEASYASGAKYRHDIALRVDLAEPRNQLVWTNIAKAIDKAGDDDRAAVDIRFFTTKPRAPGKDDRGQQVNEAMREVLTESGLPRVRGSTARLCEVRLPTAEIDPSAEMAFRQLIHLALLKLDFVARKRAHERGVPLIDLQARWSIAPDAVAEVDEEEEDDDDDDDDGTPDDTLGVQHWAGGFNEAARLEAFVSENFWEIGWSRESAKPAARRTWQRFAAIRVGDRFAIKGLGGTHDLAIRYVGRVVAVDSERGRVELQRDPVQLFRGKGPRGAGAGNWHDTLVPITRADIIAAIFGGTPAIDTSTANAAKPSNLADVPLNLILYGPPGTGKTYRLTSSLIPEASPHS